MMPTDRRGRRERKRMDAEAPSDLDQVRMLDLYDAAGAADLDVQINPDAIEAMLDAVDEQPKGR